MIEQTKPTLWVFNDFSPVGDFSDVYWRECFLDDDFKNYDVKVIDGQYIIHESFLMGDTLFKHQQMRAMLDLFVKNEIRNGDVFIFANAWNYITVPLSFLKLEFDLDIKMIGFWGNSSFNKFSPLVKRLKEKSSFGYNFEYSLYKTYDLNCFLCQEHLDMFKGRHPNIMETAKVTGYPFGYLKKQNHILKKENIIFTPYPITDAVHNRIWKGLQSDHKNYLFINSMLTHQQRDKFKELIKASKFLFSAREFEYDPVLIYESMLNGVVPLIQNRYLYQVQFPEYYLIPKLNLNKKNPYLNMMRTRFAISDWFFEKIEQYDHWSQKAKEDADIIGKNFYSNDKFLNELTKLTLD